MFIINISYISFSSSILMTTSAEGVTWSAQLINFADKRRSLGRYSSLADSGHGGFLMLIFKEVLGWGEAFGLLSLLPMSMILEDLDARI
jgi:hypothetical protein